MCCKGRWRIPASAFTARPSVDLQVQAPFVLNDLTEIAAALHSLLAIEARSIESVNGARPYRYVTVPVHNCTGTRPYQDTSVPLHRNRYNAIPGDSDVRNNCDREGCF